MNTTSDALTQRTAAEVIDNLLISRRSRNILAPALLAMANDESASGAAQQVCAHIGLLEAPAATEFLDRDVRLVRWSQAGPVGDIEAAFASVLAFNPPLAHEASKPNLPAPAQEIG